MDVQKPNPRMTSRLAILLAIVASAIGGCTTLQTSRDPGGASVPPHLEIEIREPAVDALGQPKSELVKADDGSLQIKIPPTVLVMTYYYSGDRDFQGPMLNGGPTTIVANHPVDNQRCYVDLQLPAGAPRVYYSSRKITFDFGQRRVEVVFRKRCDPVVVYRNGPSLQTRWKRTFVDSEFAQHNKKLNATAKGVATDGAAATAQAFEWMATPFVHIAQFLPFYQWMPWNDPNYVPGAYGREYFADRKRQRAAADSIREEQTRPTIR